MIERAVKLYQVPEWLGLQAGLLEFCERSHAEFPKRGAWKNGQRDLFVFDEKGGAVQELRVLERFFSSKLQEQGREFCTWLILYLKGDQIHSHNHYWAETVGVYFVEGFGDLVINLNGSACIVPFKSGQMVVFPGTCFHFVPSVKVERRVTVGLEALKI